jgi:hypothetical protein
VSVQQVHLGGLELVQRIRLGQRQESLRRVGHAGLVHSLRCGQHSLRPVPRIGAQLGGPFQERGGRGTAAAILCAAC